MRLLKRGPSSYGGVSVAGVVDSIESQDLYASGGMFRIAEQTLEANAASIDFQNIPADYKHLRIIGSIRSVKAAATNEAVLLTCNNDTTDANYRYEIRQSAAAVTVSAENIGTANARAAIIASAASSSSGDFAAMTIDIPNYASTAMTKTMGFTNHVMMARTATNVLLREGVQYWLSTSAISRLTFAPLANNFLAGSTISIYGVKTGVPL